MNKRTGFNTSSRFDEFLGQLCSACGRETPRSPEPSQAHRTIELSGRLNQSFPEIVVDFYRKGLSLSDIGKQTGKAKSTIQAILGRAGVELHPNRSRAAIAHWTKLGKGNIRPPYGFCYFQGQVAPDQREYENLQLIHRLCKEGLNPNSIATQLNHKKIPARMASSWNRNSVVNILGRFKSKAIVLPEIHY